MLLLRGAGAGAVRALLHTTYDELREPTRAAPWRLPKSQEAPNPESLTASTARIRISYIDTYLPGYILLASKLKRRQRFLIPRGHNHHFHTGKTHM